VGYFQPSLLFRHLSAEIEKNNENLHQNNQVQGRDFNALSRKYETGVILTRRYRYEKQTGVIIETELVRKLFHNPYSFRKANIIDLLNKHPILLESQNS